MTTKSRPLEIQKPIKKFIAGSLGTIVLGLFFISLFFSVYLVQKEQRRSGHVVDQLKQVFQSNYQSITEEMWTKNYESIFVRTQKIITQLGINEGQIWLLNENFDCLIQRSTWESNQICQPLSEFNSDEYRSAIKNSPNLITVNFLKPKGIFEITITLEVASLRKGYLIATLRDPYGFIQGDVLDIILKALFPGLLLMFFVWGIWLSIARKYLLMPYLENLLELEKGITAVDIAKQVAHDIRSPLSALTMVTGSLKDIPEDKRIMIRNATQRINDIANGLLQKGKATTHTGTPEKLANKSTDQAKTIEFIPALVDILVSEKRMQFREHNTLDIQTDLKNSFGSFSEINSTELKRVISNLINNAVEAFDDYNGTVTVGVQKAMISAVPRVEIFVNDNGKGIPAHLISKVGQMGFSHGKSSSGQSGSGLGLYHAKQTAESCGGSLEITSTEGKGSSIKFILPLAEAPTWFTQKIDLTDKKYLISLDDDTSIHEIWAGRLQSLSANPQFKEIEHIKFQSSEAFEKYVYANMNKIKETLFLVDFELLNQPKTGLDLIEELGLEKYSILVTSRCEEKYIQERASRINLHLLPKALAGFVPFEFRKPKLKVNAVLLDDDEIVIATWKMAARENSKAILCFTKREELFAILPELHESCPLYVDENLGNGVKGEAVSKELFNLGFKNLYLATGYPAEQFQHVTWVKAIVGKDPVV